MDVDSDIELERRPDVRFRTYLRHFGNTPEGRSYGPMALVLGISYLYKEGVQGYLIVMGSVVGIGLPVGYIYWRQKSLRDPEYAARYAEQSRVSWSSYASVLLLCGAAVAATPGYWRVLSAAVLVASLAVVVRIVRNP